MGLRTYFEEAGACGYRGSVIEDIRKTWAAFNEDKAPRLAAAIAYATIFSLVPLLVVLIAIAGYVIGVQNGGHGHHVAEGLLLQQIGDHAGREAARAVQELVAAS